MGNSHLSQRSQVVAVGGLHLIVLMLLALHLYVRTLPATVAAIPTPQDAEFGWWGLWPVVHAPAWVVWIGAVLVIGSVVGYWILEIGDWRLGATISNPQSPISHSVLILLSVLLFLAFLAFPIVHTRWGDAFMLAKGLSWPDAALRITHSWQAPLDVFVHSQVWLWLAPLFGWQDAAPVYRLLSPLAGALYLLVVLLLSRNQQLAPNWLTYGLLVSLGLIQLFFGYIENYSFAAVGVIAYLWLGVELLAGRGQLWLVTTLLAFTHATHPSTIVLAPSLLYLAWQVWTRRNISWWSTVLQVALPMVVVGGATFLWMEWSGHGLAALLNSDRPGGGDGRWLVPLWETSTRWEHYTMFSWAHLRDLLNEQMLVSPVVLPALAWLLAVRGWCLRRRSILSPHSPARFFAVASLSYLLFIWLWNPDYGGQRDWDLFSLAALPLTLWLIALLPQTLTSGRLLAAGTLPLIALQALHSAAWVYSNTLPWQWPK